MITDVSTTKKALARLKAARHHLQIARDEIRHFHSAALFSDETMHRLNADIELAARLHGMAVFHTFKIKDIKP